MSKHFIFAAVSASFLLAACSPTPQELAEKNMELHRRLGECLTEADSSAVFKQISQVESQAREIFTKQELKEYERLAHASEQD